jgi:hypothetical protein
MALIGAMRQSLSAFPLLIFGLERYVDETKSIAAFSSKQRNVKKLIRLMNFLYARLNIDCGDLLSKVTMEDESAQLISHPVDGYWDEVRLEKSLQEVLRVSYSETKRAFYDVADELERFCNLMEIGRHGKVTLKLPITFVEDSLTLLERDTPPSSVCSWKSYSSNDFKGGQR